MDLIWKDNEFQTLRHFVYRLLVQKETSSDFWDF